MFQLCGDAGGIPGAAVIQVDAKKTETKPTMIGTNNSMEVIRGSKCLYKNECYTLLCADSLADVGWSYASGFAISQLQTDSLNFAIFLCFLFLHFTSLAGDWVMLAFTNKGTEGHCSKEMSKAAIMINCNRKTDVVRSFKKRTGNVFSVQTENCTV